MVHSCQRLVAARPWDWPFFEMAFKANCGKASLVIGGNGWLIQREANIRITRTNRPSFSGIFNILLGIFALETVKDFLSKLGMKPGLYLVEISIVRLTKIMYEQPSQTYLIFNILYFLKMCPIFVSSVDNFGRSDNDMI